MRIDYSKAELTLRVLLAGDKDPTYHAVAHLASSLKSKGARLGELDGLATDTPALFFDCLVPNLMLPNWSMGSARVQVVTWPSKGYHYLRRWVTKTLDGLIVLVPAGEPQSVMSFLEELGMALSSSIQRCIPAILITGQGHEFLMRSEAARLLQIDDVRFFRREQRVADSVLLALEGLMHYFRSAVASLVPTGFVLFIPCFLHAPIGVEPRNSFFRRCNREIMERVSSDPSVLTSLHPGTFEDLIADVFEAEGCSITNISSWNEPDGGVDILAVRRVSRDMDFRIAIQCKRYAEARRVGAEPIRSLMGVLDRFHAHAGVLVTSSSFSDEAVEETRRHFWRIGLRDFRSIIGSLEELEVLEYADENLWLPRDRPRVVGGGGISPPDLG